MYNKWIRHLNSMLMHHIMVDVIAVCILLASDPVKNKDDKWYTAREVTCELS